MPAGMQAALSEWPFGAFGQTAMQMVLGEQPFGTSDIAAARNTLSEQLLMQQEGAAAARHTLSEQLLGPSGTAAASQTISEVNNITALSPEIFRVWDGDKGQYVYAPRYVWTGTQWQAIGGTVPSWKHPFLWQGV